MAIDKYLVRTVAGRQVAVSGTWDFDPGHTEITFEGRHLMVSRIRGRFDRFHGRLHVAEIPEESVAELVIEADSVASGFEDRDAHLRSPDWFDVERHPTITFRSIGLSHVDGDRWRAAGELTVRGVNRPIEVQAEFHGAVRDPWGGDRMGFVVTAEVDREAWGLTWNQRLDAGGVVVGRTVRLAANVEAVLRR
jgi:polyisoprenoid-binding protein YceI